jgi:YD repeat-containing protein
VIHLVWTAPASAVDHYQIQRGVSLAGPFTFLANRTTTNFDDLSVMINHSYLYRVLAVNSVGVQSGPSNMAFGTSMTFLDESLYAGVTVVQAQHFDDLRRAVEAVRALVPGMSPGSWSQNNLHNAPIYGTDLQELRDQLDEALAALSVPVLPYEDAQLGHGVTLIRKKHVEQLRERSNRGRSASAGAASGGSESAIARLDPFNQTGNQLQARDCEWNVGLLNLPGRAGLDLGLGLSYSSLVWTRALSYMYFDEDNGSPSPGFRLGFPIIQGSFVDPQAGVDARLLITSSGRRVELRKVGTTNIYESADSSYLQLIDYGTSLLVRSTDGSQMNYAKFGDDWHCTSIEDRNGNLILVSYDGYGEMQNITDTLGRVITFNYDSNANLSTITQIWNGQTHTWASFGWSTKVIHPSFGLPVVGTYDGETIPVLTQVGLPDGSRYNFEYTDRGQVNIIRRYSYDDVQRSATTYSYSSPTNDCPRINDARVTVDKWTGLNGVPAEVVTQFADGGDGSHVLTLPDGSVYKEFYSGSGWQRGLVAQTENWSGGTRQKWTTTAFTQDNTAVAYQTNPRVIETNIHDVAGNHRRMTIDYDSYAQYGLPHIIHEFAADAITEIRRSYTDYNLNQAFLDRRIIGLVATQRLYDPATGQWQQKTTYTYDSTTINSQATTAPGHDQSYVATLIVRGNVTGVSRWDVNDIDNSNKALTSAMTYNAAGSLLSATDPAGHGNSVAYGDAFSDNNNSRGTFAYPTTLTDADGYQSTVQYNFDFGLKTRVQGPPPAGQSQGAIQTLVYDNAQRVHLMTTTNTGAYTRTEYGFNYIQSYGSVNNAEDAYAVQMLDGAGRVYLSATNHPGSQGGYTAQWTQYDLMGRVKQQSNPTEILWDWNPYGDDGAGWVFTQQTYDWKGRPLETTNQDGHLKYASYSACGCAGSEVATLTDEVGRQQKVYSDALGRQWKTEVLNDNGGVYSSTASIYNARDQVTAVNTYNGSATSDLSCPSGTCMQSLTTYDGYGRVASQRLPQQTAATSYEYNSDDAVRTVTDPRGVIATNTYNNRRLLTGISYTPASGVDSLTAVSFGYDAVGNRTSMSDGTGSIGYVYNSLSRITSETRTFIGLGNQYAISYGYNLAGQLTSITDPSGAQVSYNYDATGRLSSMPASGYTGVTNFLSNAQYRASGAMKHATYGNSVQVDLTYNSRLQIGQYQVSGFQSPYGSMGATMSYYDDGRTNTAYDLNDSRFDRKYEFDFAARLKEAYSGVEAHGQPPPPLNQANSPYRQSYTYDQGNNVTLRTGRIWSSQNEYDAAGYGSDNKRGGWGYDAAGNATFTGYSDGTRTYDAAGRPATFISSQTWQVYPNWPSGHPDAPALETQDTFDGTGQVVKHINHVRHDDTYDLGSGNIVYTMSDTTTTAYYLRSTVLGGKTIAELDQSGVKTKGYVYAGGARVATQTVYGSSNAVQIESTNPVTGAAIVTDANGSSAARQEPDPLGRELAQVPDPTVVVDPLSSSKWNEPMPIEYTGGPTAEYEQANADWAHDMALRSLGTAIKNNYKATSQLILEKNPNIGVRTSGGRTLYGNDAANYLNTLSQSYGADTSSSDQNEHDVASPYNMTIYGGPEVFVDSAQQGGVEGIRSRTVLDVPSDLTMQYWIQNHWRYGTGGCAQFPQILADHQGVAMGFAGGGRWRAGDSVMGSNIQRGTVIASGWVDGYYPNYGETGSHVAIFLRWVEGGFEVLEQSRWSTDAAAHVRTHPIKTTDGNYYSNPNAYRIVEVGPPVPGIPYSRGLRP